MNRIRPFAIALAAILTLGVATSAHAQTDTKHPYSGAVSGTITAIDATAKTLTVKGPNDDGGVFAVNADTQVMNDAKTVKVEDLKVGWGVTVSWDYAAVESKSKVAKLIEVTEAP